MTPVRLLTVMVASSLLAACGARASLAPGEVAAGGSGGAGGGTGGGPGGTGGTTVVDAGPDVIVTDAGCQSASECDDGIACTLDACEGGLCTHTPRDFLCDDGVYCDGAERCDPFLGCTATPVACDDGIGCTHDVCDEASHGCVHTPDDGLCPLSHKCGPTEGCYALAYAHSDTTLYEVRLPSGKVTKIGPTLVQLTDIALVSNTQLLGLDYGSLYLVDTTTGAAKPSAPAHAQGMVAFDVAPDGQLYGAGTGGIYRLGLTPPTADWVASFPPGWQASGDIAFLQGRFLATARQGFGGADSLVEVDLGSGTSKVLGSTGFNCVWGLAAFGTTLYGLTCNGQVISIDPKSGAGTQLSSGSVAFWGAAAR
jgi:hypothetical protein